MLEVLSTWADLYICRCGAVICFTSTGTFDYFFLSISMHVLFHINLQKRISRRKRSNPWPEETAKAFISSSTCRLETDPGGFVVAFVSDEIGE